MQRSTRKTLLTVIVASSAALASVALGANSGSFGDLAGDSGDAPDLTALSVSNDDGGTVTIRVAASNRAALEGRDELTVGIDADQNADTGSVFYGADFGVRLGDGRSAFLLPTGAGFLDEVAKPSSFQGSFTRGVATFSFKAADTSLSPSSGMGIFAVAIGNDNLDMAPDIRAANYQFVAGTSSPALGADTRPPLDEAYESSGRHNLVARLKYSAMDGRGETADTIRIYRGHRLLKRIEIALGDRNPYALYWVLWHVPPRMRANLRFCVSSVDRAGNKSNLSCAPLIVR